MRKTIIVTSLLGSLILIAHTASLFQVTVMLLLFGAVPGTSLVIPPVIMLSLWLMLLVVLALKQYIRSSHFQLHTQPSSPAAKRRVNA